LDDSGGDGEQIASQIRSLLSSSPNAEKQPTVRLAIHFPLESLPPMDAARALVNLADLVGPAAAVRIIFHSRSGNIDWPTFHRLVEFLRSHLTRFNDIPTRLVSPFREFHEELCPLFNLGIRIRFAAGWLPECQSEEIPAIDLEVLRKLTEFGFRT